MGTPSQSSWKGNNKHLNCKERIKLSLFADDMNLCIENPKGSTEKLLELINKSSKVAGKKVNTEIVFLYMCDELSKKKIKEVFPFKIVPKRVKYLEINLTKEKRHAYWELQNIAERDLKKTLIQWKDITYLWVGRLNIAKMSILLRMIYKFNAIPIRIPKGFLFVCFCENAKAASQIYVEL